MDATVQKTAIGTVSATRGEVFAKDENGTVRRLHLGDTVYEGEIIITATGSSIEIAMSTGQILAIHEQQTVALDAEVSGAILEDTSAAAVTPLSPSETATVIQALTPGAASDDPNLLLEQEAAAAGLAGGGGSDGGSSFVRLFGVTEDTSPTSFEFGENPDGSPGTFEGTAQQVDNPPLVSVSVQVGVSTSETPIHSGEVLATRPDIPLVAASAADVVEGSSGGFRPVTFYILLDQAFDHDVTVTYEIEPINGITYGSGPDGDFFDGALTGTVVIPAGNIGFAVTENIVEDRRDEGNEQFQITLTSATGATIDPSAATATVTIIDDDTSPVANDDTNVVAEDGFEVESESQTVSVSGNVLQTQAHGEGFGDNADSDADGDTLFVLAPGTFVGDFGTLVLGADGSYVYTLDNESPAIQSLAAGETLTDSFGYSATDQINSPASATLTITIDGSNDVPQLTADPGNEGGNDQVFEAGLAAGSNAAAGSEFAAGTFMVADADGLDDLVSVTINGDTVAVASLVGHVFNGTHGTLTVNGFSGGTASYTYQLTEATTDGAGTETDQFTLTVSDGTASSSPATITIEIVDDVPRAVDDSNAVSEDAVAAITGNVLANDLHPNGQPGADTPTSFVSWASTAATYGSFTDTGSGGYSYTLDNSNTAVQALDAGETLTETFAYTMQDADGDQRTATLTITINGTNDVPQITADPGNEGGNDVVFEAGLAAGSNAAATSELSTGTFTVSDADGVDDLVSVTINGDTVAMASLVGHVFNGSHGTLTVDSFTGGVASYTYALTGPTTDLAGTESDQFTLTTSDGTTSSASATITIEIVDDVPRAVDDGNAVSEDAVAAITGNVLANDLHLNGQPGADTPIGFVSWASTAATYGSFTDTGSGGYSYTLDNGNAAVQALDAGETLTETFDYTMQDADGDQRTATLTITINGSNDVPQITADPGNEGGNDQVFEAGLAAGSNAAANSELATGSFTVSDADGLDDLVSVTINGDTVAMASLVGHVFNGTHGTLTVDSFSGGIASYTYALTEATTDLAGTETDQFTLTTSDGTATSASATITIEIVDDVPRAVDDGNAVSEDAVAAITGNVLANDLHPNGQPGADTPTSFVSWASTAATYGSFTDTGSGGYSYTLDNGNAAVQALDAGETLTETFAYTMQDADGDQRTTTLTITINGTNDVPQITADPGNEGGNDVVFEAGLAAGSNAAAASELATGSFTVSDADGLDDLVSVTINGDTVAVASLVGHVFNGTHGTLTVNSFSGGIASYTYALTEATTDLASTETDQFTLTTSDGTATSAPATITIEIVDDIPRAVDDSNAVSEDAVAAITGNVLTNDLHPNGQPGADTPTSFVSWASTAATYGTFTDTSSGGYSYTLNNSNAAVQALDAGETLTETFAYTMQDADGDQSTATLTITINGTNDVPQITADPGNEGGNDQVFEAGLAAGSNAAAASELATGSFTVSDADGLDDLQSVTINGDTVAMASLVGHVFNGTHGTLTVNSFSGGTASYTYELTGPTTDAAGTETDQFTLTTSDGTATSAPATITIEIVDDVPRAVDDSNAVSEDAVAAITGNVLANDLHPNGQPGADTPTSFVSWASTAATYGSFTDTGSGGYSYTLDNSNPAVEALDPGQSLTETFAYTMQDADGDQRTATLTITINGNNDVPEITADPGNEGGNDQVFEAGLAAGSNAAAASEVATGTFTVSDGDGLADLQSVTINGDTVLMANLVGHVFNGTHGTLTVDSFTGGVASYTYALTGPTTDLAGTETDQFTLTVSDGTASSSPAMITIEIVDDMPRAVDDSNAVSEDAVAAITGNVLTNDLHPNGQPGADTPTSFVSWASTAATYGSFTDTGSGGYSYTLDNGNAAVQALDAGESLTETFSYTMQDADGDQSTATLTITINGSNDVPQITADPGNEGGNDQVFEAGLAAGSNAAANSELATGSFTVSDADGLDDLVSVTINGDTVAMASLVGHVFNGTHGTLTVDSFSGGIASYTYALTEATTDLAGTETDQFTLTTSDGTISSTLATITIEIVDDVPRAVDDSNAVSEDAVAAIAGNVLTNDLHPNGQPGADTPTSFVSWASTAATYGSFTDTGSGGYSYTLNNSNATVQALDAGETLTETFAYTMQDADGDQRTATLTITINGSNDVPQITADPGNEGGNDQVFEAGLAAGSNAAASSEFATGNFTVTDADGLDDLQSVTINGDTVLMANLVGHVFNGTHGTLTVNSFSGGTASYTYQLTEATTDLAGTETDQFALTTSDGTATSASATITIEIVDDVPRAVDDSNAVSEDAVAAITGNVLANDLHPNGQPGADTPTSFVSWVSTAASYGTFTDTGSGGYSYTLDNSNAAVQALDAGESLTETFAYTMQDADGDQSSATLTITIDGTNDVPQITADPGNEGGNDVVFEAGLAAGSNAAAASELATGSFTVSDADGLDDLQSVTINGDTVAMANLVGHVFNGTHGTLTVNSFSGGTASYTYALTEATTDLAGTETDQFTLTTSDGTATSAPATITIEIVDDVPRAVDDGNAVSEDAVAAITGNVLANDLHLNGQPGADTPTSFVSWASTAASYGTFTDTGSGGYSYTLDNSNAAVQALDAGESLTETFAYTMQDADGDQRTATLTITINGTNDVPQITADPGNEGGNDQVFEAGLAAGSNAAANSEFATGTFTVSDADGLDDLQSVTINGDTVAMASLVGHVFNGTHGTLTVNSFSGGTASYTYQLTEATTDLAGTETDQFTLTTSDGTTTSASATITIEIVDDVPRAVDDSNAVSEDAVAAITGNVLANDLHPNGQPGADTPTSFVSWASTAATYGSFTDTGSGGYSYTLDNSNAAVQALDAGESLTETFAYTMQDADGDQRTATLTITINGTNDVPQITADPGNEGGNDQVFEAGLAAGSNAAAASELATGSFTVSDADGLDDLQSVTINGDTVLMANLVGHVFNGTHGTLIINSFSGGAASYTYELTGPTTDAAGTETDQFTLTTSDGTATSAPATITIEIVDDVPRAVDDSNAVSEDAVAAITGNVLSNDLHLNGQPGADTPTSFVSWASTAATYGSFTDTGSGGYSYTLDNSNASVQALDAGESLTETFAYTMQDADGDQSTATLTITINGTNDVPQITADPGNEGGNDQVFEAGLAAGSNAAASSELATGSFTVSDADGLDDLQSVTINGDTVLMANLVGHVFNGTHGTLTVNSFSGGIASYTYALTEATTDLAGTETDQFTLTTSDGTATSAPATITIEIVDDVPRAVDDGNAVSEDAVAAITGNVLTNDLHPNGQPGADTPTSFVSWASTAATYGSFTDTGSGGFSYTLDNSNAAVQALDAGESLTETFSYTMQDADGDQSTATLTITINGSNDVPQITADPGNEGGNDQVFEAGLAAGSNAAANSELATGSFTVSDADGLDDLVSVTINGDTVAMASLVGHVFNGTHGTLTVNSFSGGIASYTYALTEATTDLAGTETDQFTLTTSDGTTSSASATITIEIVDDVPRAVDDSNAVSEDAVAAITGNVLANDLHLNGQPGADTPTSFVSWASTAATYGSFTDTGSGGYSYTLNNSNAAVQALDAGESLTETFAYTMQDADGDQRTATLTITINGSNDVPQITADPGNEGGNDVVFEAGLAAGSNAAAASELATGSFTVSDADGLDDLVSVTINGDSVLMADLVGHVFNGSHGTLTVDSFTGGVASYTYELTGPTTDLAGTESDQFTLTTSDGTTSSTPATITIEIVDDVPRAVDDGNAVSEDAVAAITGNVLTNDLHPNGQPGADTPASFVSWASTAATYGSFTDTGSGGYSYTLNNSNAAVQTLDAGESLTETFAYTMQDADGDQSTATLTITINGTNDIPQITADPGNEGGNDQVFEAGLAAGSNAADNCEIATGTFTVSDADGLDDLQSVTINGDTVLMANLVGHVFNGTHGTLTVDSFTGGTASYTYELTGPTTDAAGTETDQFTLTTSDGTATSAPATITIEIVDDVPRAVDDSNAVSEDAVAAITGNVLTNDLHLNGQPGADTPTSFVSWASTAATYGSFTDTGNGGYSYTLDNSNATVQALDAGETLTETFAYTMQDADGDQRTATLTITINGSNDTPVLGTATATVSEEGLSGANADTTGTPTDTTNSATASGDISIADADDAVFAVTLLAPTAGVFKSGGQDVVWTGSGTGTLTGSVGSTTVITVAIDNTGHYTVTLSGPIDHAAGNAENLFAHAFTVNVSDGTATTATTLTLTIEDDSPILAVTNGIIQNGIGSELVGTLAAIGADSVGGQVVLSGTPPVGLTSNGNALEYTLSNGGTTLTATDSVTDQTVFILQTGSDGGYVFTQSRLLDLSVLNSNLQSSVGAGGPQPAYFMYADGSFGSVENANDWAVKITGSADINPSTQGMGVQNNHFSTGETMKFEFDDEAADTASTTANPAYRAAIGINDMSGTETLLYTAYFTNGTNSGLITVGVDDLVNGEVVIQSPDGAFIDYVDLAAGAGTDVRVTSVKSFILDDTKTQDLTFGFVATDGDGDDVAGSLTITAQNSHTLTGDANNNALGGGTGADTLSGLDGDDMLIGGAGGDSLSGGVGADTFVWRLGDQNVTAPVDHIVDWGNGLDAVNLRDLLQGELHTAPNDPGNLTNYLHFSYDSGTGDTTLVVKSDGTGLTGGNLTTPATGGDQIIVFDNVDLTVGATNQADVITALLSTNKLITD